MTNGMPKKTHKKQHYIPQSYLAAWCDPSTPAEQEPYVWVFPKEGGGAQRKAPRNLFTETDMYTFQSPEGIRDLSLEHGLSGLESDFARVRRDVIAKRIELSAQDRIVLLAFVAATVSRTPKQRDHWQAQWNQVLSHMDRMRDAVEKLAPEERAQLGNAFASVSSGNAGMGYDDVAKLAAEPLQHSLVTTISTQLQLMYTMDIAIISTDDDLGFITSDAPCVWFDPDSYKRPALYQAPGLGWPKIEVTLPISPSQLLLVSHSGLRGYQMTTTKIVDELNRRTRGHTYRAFVGSQNRAKEVWYDMGAPPVT